MIREIRISTIPNLILKYVDTFYCGKHPNEVLLDMLDSRKILRLYLVLKKY